MSSGSKQTFTSMVVISKNVDYYLSSFDASIFILEFVITQEANQCVDFFTLGCLVVTSIHSTWTLTQEMFALSSSNFGT